MAFKTKDGVITDAATDYLSTIDPNNPLPAKTIRDEILEKIKTELNIQNSVMAKCERYKMPDVVPRDVVALIIIKMYRVIKLVWCEYESGHVKYDIAIYDKDTGLYTINRDKISEIAHLYNRTLTMREVDEIMQFLAEAAPMRNRESDPDLIAVNNGIFNYKAKQLEPFTPDRVFVAKSHVDYNPNAVNVIIHNDEDNTDWDVESWMCTLSDDPEVIALLWQVLGAIIRPYVRWNKSAWLYSEKGNNGKGTLCELMRSLCGRSSCAAIPLNSMGEKFALECLTDKMAIITDENDVGTYIDKASNLKDLITNDPMELSRKYQKNITFQFHGFMVQCLNEMPRVKDKTDSFYRRQLFIPMTKCFNGIERKYIKNDYLHRKEVLEYVLFKVLCVLPDYYQLAEPQACMLLMNEYKTTNDPVREFLDFFLNQLVWDFVPYSFLYDLYKVWSIKTNPSGVIISNKVFTHDVKNILADDKEWIAGEDPERPGQRMNDPEPLILDYDLKEWMAKGYNGTDPNKKCMTTLAEKYRGLSRRIGRAASSKNI